MKISLNWIKKYLPGLGFESVDNLKEKMISAGLDIENIEIQSDVYKNFVVGEVLEKIKHPNAEKLSVCKVNVGTEILNIVCGAPNVGSGQKVCVAKIGAVIPNGGFEIKKAKIRGEKSEGMICSDSELNISDNHDGIKILDKDAVPGHMFSDYLELNDIIFEIGITPNRGDLFSHFGVAREIAAIYNLKLTLPEIILNESGQETKDLIDIKIENKNLCRRFTGRVIKNVDIKDSPEWLKQRLISIGLRPRNNIVDITNFVMFETGQPLHAFDYDKIRGKKIIIKNALEGDKFITLDSKERTLSADSLMVCDAEGYSGIAGVMGGEHSEITDETKNVFLESAYFDPISIRLNSKKLALNTDASYRFERGVDINMVGYASNRAAQLIHELSGGEISKDLADVYPGKSEAKIVGIRTQKSNDLLGLNLNDDEIIELLSKIEIKFIGKKDEYLNFEIPGFRSLDLEREVDIIEEVARVYGYDNIKQDENFNINTSNLIESGKKEIKIKKIITDHMIGRGFNQVITNPIVDYQRLKKYRKDIVRLKNSISSGMDALRTDLKFEMLNAVRYNLFHSGKDLSVKFFETGKVFSNTGEKFAENEVLMMVMSGKRDTEYIYGGDKYFDIYDIKGEAEMLLCKLNLENYRLFYYNDNNFDGVKIDISLNNEVIGNINKADKKLREEFEIENDVFYAEIFTDKLTDIVSFSKYFNEISKYPSVKRDIAIIVDEKINYDELKESVYKTGGKMLSGFELFDLYHDDKLGLNKKSVAFSLEFLSNEKTMTDDEVNELIYKIVTALESKFGAKLRS